MPKQKNIALYSGVVAAIGLLAACSGGQNDDTTTAPAATTAAPAATPAAQTGAAPAAAAAPAADNTETMDGSTLADFTGDPEHGKTVFLQCKSCHVREPGVNRIGPSLAGVVGREAGSVEGFNYSPANANSGITWTPEKLFQYLENPQRVVPGTKMTFAGLPKPQDRADVIAYLQTPPE